MPIKDYSTTPASNTSLFPEGMAPSVVNDSARQVQADIRSWYNTAEWQNLGNTPTYVSATSFSVTGNQTAFYPVGRRVKIIDSSTLYGTIATSAFGSVTTVTITLDSGSITASISAVEVGIVSIPAGGVGSSIVSQAPADGSITPVKLANADFGAFTVASGVASLDANSVNTAAVTDNAVTNTKLADMAANTVKVRAANSSGDPSDIALAANQFIGRAPTGDIVAGTFGTNLSWSGTTLNAVGNTGGLTVIGTSTPTGVTTVTFSAIPQTYRGLYLVWTGVSCDTATRNLIVQADYGAGFSNNALSKKILGTTVSALTGADLLSTSTSLTAAQDISGFVKFLPYQAITSLAGGNPVREYDAFYYDSVGAFATIKGAISTNAGSDTGITGMRLIWNSTGNFDAGTIILYGIN